MLWRSLFVAALIVVKRELLSPPEKGLLWDAARGYVFSARKEATNRFFGSILSTFSSLLCNISNSKNKFPTVHFRIRNDSYSGGTGRSFIIQ
ncbi:hypothetical protein TNCV_460321 [Trichonephila clavipes]|nr:hypothetical protein TNCV_460321 [Trichonephila clavipes]